MNASKDCTSPEQQCDFAKAFAQFRHLLDPADVNALQPLGPATVYTTWVVVWLLVYQRLHGNASLQEAVAELVQSMSELSENRRVVERTLSGNTGAYSRARSRLKPEVAEQICDKVYETLVAALPPSFGGRRVLIVDGTAIPLVPTPALVKAFPPASNQNGLSAWPLCHMVVAHELSSGCAIRPEIGPKYGPQALGEVALAEGLILRLPARSVLLADRNFGVFAMAQPAVASEHDVVFRLTQSRFKSMVRLARPQGSGTWDLLWKPSPKERRAHPEWAKDVAIQVRLHAVQVRADLTLWLMTTLTCSAQELADLYRLRLDVETDIRDVKITLKTDDLLSKSVDMLKKEIAMAFVAYNLVVQVRRLAAQRAGVKPRRLSFSGVWSLVKIILLRPVEATSEQWQERFELVLRACGQRKLPNRPGRQYPRQVIHRRRKFPSRPSSSTKKTTK
jgi:hypothetical protein